MAKEKKKYNLKYLSVLIGIIVPLLIEKYYFDTVPFSFDRFFLFFFLLEFLIMHIFISPKKIWDFMYKYRYLVGLLIFVYFVANGYHGSSIGMYNYYIEPESVVWSAEPLLGKNRGIRSDEWMVGSMYVLSQNSPQNNYDSNNKTIMGNGGSVNLYPKLPAKSLSILTSPQNIGYLFLPVNQAFSFSWNFCYFITFFAAFEFFMLILKKNRLWSLVGAIVITLAPAVVWWDSMVYIYSGLLAIVFFNIFLNNKGYLKKVICSMLIGWLLAIYASSLYPAWMIPYGYFYLALVIWLLFKNKGNYKLSDIILLGIIVLGTTCVLLIPFLIQSKDILLLTSNTVYPGSRIDYGGYGWNSLFNYIFSIYLPFFEFSNPSEFSQFYCFFPISIIVGINTILTNKKVKKMDGLLIILVAIPIFLSIWNFVKLPGFLVKITFLSYSTPKRTVITVGYVMTILLIYCLANYQKEYSNSHFNRFVISLLCTTFALYVVSLYGEMSFKMIFGLVLIFVFTNYFILNNNKKNNIYIAIILSALALISGLFVHPLIKNLDVVYKKPVSIEIQKIVSSDPNALWASVNDFFVVNNYVLANGARTLNSTNFYPNMNLWKEIDPDNKYIDIWNRYSHLNMVITLDKTTVSLLGPDSIVLYLNNHDICKLGINYFISSDSELESYSNDIVDINKIYGNQNMYIYKILCD